MMRFKFPRHAQQFCISHAFTRFVLSQYHQIPLSDWRFRKGTHGKPYILNSGFEGLQFSLSHTQGLQAMAVCEDKELGFDVEYRNRKVRGPEIAHRYFSKMEIEELLGAPHSDQRQRFFDYWTLKESFIKAKGKGLAIPLGKFSFSLNQHPIGFSADSAVEPDPARWYFQLFEVGEEHAAALCSQYPNAIFRFWKADPLLSYEAIELPKR